jgi:hypothetical protein
MFILKLKTVCAIALLAIASVAPVQAGKDFVPAKVSLVGVVVSDVTLPVNPFIWGTPFRHVTAQGNAISSHQGTLKSTLDFFVHLEPIISGGALVGVYVVSKGGYQNVTANGAVVNGIFKNVRISMLGAPVPELYEYTIECWGEDGSHYTGSGWLTHEATFGFDISGVIPNRGKSE